MSSENGMPATRVHDVVKRRRGYGLIHRDDGVWQWKVGRTEVTIYSPSGKRLQASCQSVSGVDDWERARWKGYDQITPLMVKRWIDACV